MILPDNAASTPTPQTPTAIQTPIWSYDTVPQQQGVVSFGISPNETISPWGPGGSGTLFDQTLSTFTVPTNAQTANESINDLSVNVTITDPGGNGLGELGDLFIYLFTPNGQDVILYYKPGDTNRNLTNVTFSDDAAQSILLANGPYTNGTFQGYNTLDSLNGGPVAGQWELGIDNYSSINTGTLVSWSITMNPTAPVLKFQTGAAMDQNADGTSDENPVIEPFTGLTPGDAYMAPMPAPSVPVTFNLTNYLNPPFDQNTLPLVFPGPSVASTSVPGGTGER